MTTTETLNVFQPNLYRGERIARVTLGAAMIGTVYLADTGALGWEALLPLLAIYPIFTGLIGFDPIRNILQPTSIGYRLGSAVASAMLIAATAFATAPLGLNAAWALIGVIPMVAAVTGRSAASLLFGAIQGSPIAYDATAAGAATASADVVSIAQESNRASATPRRQAA